MYYSSLNIAYSNLNACQKRINLSKLLSQKQMLAINLIDFASYDSLLQWKAWSNNMKLRFNGQILLHVAVK